MLGVYVLWLRSVRASILDAAMIVVDLYLKPSSNSDLPASGLVN